MNVYLYWFKIRFSVASLVSVSSAEETDESEPNVVALETRHHGDDEWCCVVVRCFGGAAAAVYDR
jgi:hypothetical protein